MDVGKSNGTTNGAATRRGKTQCTEWRGKCKRQKVSKQLSDGASIGFPPRLTNEHVVPPSNAAKGGKEPNSTALTESANHGSVPKDVPCFQQSNDSLSCGLASSRITFVLPCSASDENKVVTPVYLHIYELSHGILHRHSKKVTGKYVKGVYHSAVVCYGMEFFFEGGITVTCAGRTRFGEKFDKVEIGHTNKPLSSFLDWAGQRSRSTYIFHSYHPTEHNCHTFTSDAISFLMGPEASLPSYLTETIDTIVKTPVGTGVVELLVHFLGGMKYVAAENQRRRMSERKACLTRARRCIANNVINTTPPASVTLFRVSDPSSCHRTLAAVEPYGRRLLEHKAIEPPAMNFLRCVQGLCAGVEFIDPDYVTEYVNLATYALIHTTPTLRGPILNSLRVAVLHKMVLCTCAFHPLLLCALSETVRNFMNLTAEGRLALLRLLCNMGGSIHGAVALSSAEYSQMWVAAAGQAVMDYRNPAIVYTGAALIANLAVAFVLTENFVSKTVEYPHISDQCHNLITVTLFYLGSWPRERVPEAATTLMLFALFILLSSSFDASRAAKLHPFQLNFDCLIREVRTLESSTLIRMLQDILRCPHA